MESLELDMKPRENGDSNGELEPCIGFSSDQKPPAIIPRQKSGKYSSQSFVAKPEKRKSKHFDKLCRVLGVSKRGLFIVFVLFCFVLLLLSGIVALAVLWPKEVIQEPPDICASPTCLRASASVIESRQANVSPCDDFWTYSCGGWLEHNPLPTTTTHWNVYENLIHTAKDRIRRIIATNPHPTRVDSVAWKVKYFYDSCTALEHLVVPEQKLLRIIDQMGGWGVLRSFSVYSWNFKMVLRRLHAEYGVNAFFRLDVTPHPYDSTRNIVKISPDGLGLRERNYYYIDPEHKTIAAYKQLLKDSVQLLGATSPEAAKFAEELFHFEKRLAELTPTMAEQKMLTLATPGVMTVSELQQISFTVPWLEVLRASFPGAAIDDKSEILVVSGQYLRDVSSIISSTDRSTLNNYLMWRFTNDYLQYLSKEFSEVLVVFRAEVMGAIEPKPRWEMCLETTSRYFGLALGAFYAKFTDEVEDNKDTVMEIFDTIKNAIGSTVASSPWYSAVLRSRALEKLRAVKVQVGFPDYISRSYLENHYSAINVQVNDFLGNVLYGVHFLRKLQEKRLTSPAPEMNWIDSVYGNEIVYVTESNLVVVPQSLLHPPFILKGYPLPMLYGGLGVRLANVLVKSVTNPSVLYNTDGNLTNDTDIIEDSANLLSSQGKCLLIDTPDKEEEAEFMERTTLSTMVELAATRQAFKALRKLISEQPHRQYIALEDLDSGQIFFTSYAQSLCSINSEQYSEWVHTVSLELEERQRLSAILGQLPEFSQTFHCFENSTHYPKRSCGRVL
ncbi:endothelin-converting enzyme 1-like isoform X2 [Artemia franciscana]|uniref:endothelin-converting enzyme 1-like isoform X2 n=1 Tax=Artemia franciscana TaxID=6661 RepID=UPI0032DB6771